MQSRYARNSILLFGISIIFLIGLTAFESRLAGMTQQMERLITFVLLVLPAAIGSVFGMVSLARKEGQTWLAVAGMVLNALFALFHIVLILFAG